MFHPRGAVQRFSVLSAPKSVAPQWGCVPATIPLVYTLLGILQVIISGILIFLILLHSGKDTGLSGAFGIGGGGSSFGGGSMVERNLDRATVFFGVVFVLNTIVLLKI
jgi:preprotein translocase subunit SecG